MASTELSRRVEKLVGYPPLSEMSDYRSPLWAVTKSRWTMTR